MTTAINRQECDQAWEVRFPSNETSVAWLSLLPEAPLCMECRFAVRCTKASCDARPSVFTMQSMLVIFVEPFAFDNGKIYSGHVLKGQKCRSTLLAGISLRSR